MFSEAEVIQLQKKMLASSLVLQSAVSSLTVLCKKIKGETK